MRRYGLRDDQWERIKGILPGRKGSVGVTAKDNRLFVEAVLYRYRAGIPWRDLPERFGDFRVVHTRHSRWSKTGVWKKILATLSREADNEYAMIDSTIVRAHQHSAGASKKIFPRGSRDWQEPGRLFHQDSCRVRCVGKPNGFSPHCRTTARPGGRGCAHGSLESGGRRDRRQSL